MLFPPRPRPLAPHRVVVTGAGIVSGLGVGWHLNAAGFREGRQAFRPVTLFDVSRQRARIAAEVDLPAELPATRLPPRRFARMDRGATLLLLAAIEAWEQCGWTSGSDIALVLGTTGGGTSLGERYVTQTIRFPRALRSQATRVLEYQAQRQAMDVRSALGFSGPITIVANACASGANAVGIAWHLLRTGQADRAMTGGYDALCQFVFAGFDALQALSTTPCRPFDAARSGLTLGEGAAVLCLETLDDAQRRGADILGELIGYAAATDTHHLTQPHSEGTAALATMAGACQVAGITPNDVDYLNAHGTATLQNDRVEALAIRRWAGPRVTTLPVSSTKAAVGHTLGAAGAMEAVVTLMTLREQWLPPQPSLVTPDPECAFPIVRQPAASTVNVAVSNSFGFGGANASLILRRWA
jgi:3-oxoacyl-[acyl-carrier-protein] synthase II